MPDLTTTYLGLTLANPIVPSSSPLTRDLASAKRLEDAGAAAIVMHSLFEEEIRNEYEQMERFVFHQVIGHAEAQSFHPEPGNYKSRLDTYLEQLQALKQALGIPVIASLNGISTDGWVEHGKQLQQAGADALELNVYYIPVDADETASEVEQRYIDLLIQLRQHVQLPISMKLSSQFSSPGNMVRKLQTAGAAGVSLFNRFYQPDIDLETLRVQHHLELSTSAEALLRIRWVALLRDQVTLTLAVTGGLHTEQDILKALLAGADVTHLCSELLKNGPERIRALLSALNTWMEEREYDSVRQLKGSVSRACAIDPAAYEHANYQAVLDSFSPAAGVRK